MKARVALAFTAAVCCVCLTIFLHPDYVSAGQAPSGSSILQIVGKDGKVTGFVPLRHTGVKAEISGYVARIEVTQEFENVLPDAVEAVYVFPLPHDSAVDGMTMKVGEREIQAVIKEREEARKIFDAARQAGHTAALLDQERPNIFTQSVTNIPPGGKVEIKLSVLELLKYEAGTYEFAFPTVVGPRYIPGNPQGAVDGPKPARANEVSAGSGASVLPVSANSQDRGTTPDTDQVPDASKISPPVAGVHTNDASAGHDFSIEVNLVAGVPIGDVESTSHKILAGRTGPDSFQVKLADDAVLPNKDFILKYKVASAQIGDAVLAHADKSGGYFTLILQPPEKVSDEAAVPRQLIFVLDTSGSMWGFPLEMAKKTIARALDNLRKDETFNLITFSGATRVLFPEPVPATPENIAAAKRVLAGAYGSGGTEMMKAIRTALGDDAGANKPMEGDPVRVVCFMTDGYVGNDAEIVAEVKKHPDARVFAFGIGTAVNRFLLSKMSEEGHGEVEFVTNPKEAEPAADRFYERVHTPVLANISIDWGALPVTDVYPREVRDLFSAKPLIVTGRFTRPATGKIVIKGTQGNGEFSRAVPVDFTAAGAQNAALEKIWARHKVEDLMSQDWLGIQQGQSKYKADIIKVGLEHSLATQYTSFVAVEERTVVKDGKPVRVEVPVDLPENVSPLAVPGAQFDRLQTFAQLSSPTITMKNSLLPVPTPMPSPSYIGGQVSQIVVEAESADVISVPTRGNGGNGPGKARDDKPAERKELQQKLSSELLQLYDCAVARKVSTAGSTCKTTSGPVKVKVELAATSAEVVQKLSRAGFKTENGAGTMQLTGSILPQQLKQLAEIAEVKSVSLAK